MRPEEIPEDLARQLAACASITEHAARNALATVADAFLDEGWHRGMDDAMDAFVSEDQRLQAALRCPECGTPGWPSAFGGIEHSSVADEKVHYVTWPAPYRRASLDVLRDVKTRGRGLPGV